MTNHRHYRHSRPCARVLFICKRRLLYGEAHTNLTTTSGLYNSAHMVAVALNKVGFETKLVDVQDANDIDREVHSFNATHVIIEAFWVTPEKLLELLKLHKHRKWVIRNHSKTPFLASEGIAIPWMLEYIKLGRRHPVIVAPNSLEVVREIFDAYDDSLAYLPNIYTAQPLITHPEKSGYVLDIGCFGALRLLKNQCLQALAVIAYARKVGVKARLHLNADRQEQMGSQVLKGIRAIVSAAPFVELIEHPWLARDDFLDLIGTMDVNLQVSYTETFNIVLADAVSQGSPVVGSADIPWLPYAFQADPNDMRDIVHRIAHVLSLDRAEQHEKNMEALNASNDDAIKKWLRFL